MSTLRVLFVAAAASGLLLLLPAAAGPQTEKPEIGNGPPYKIGGFGHPTSVQSCTDLACICKALTTGGTAASDSGSGMPTATGSASHVTRCVGASCAYLPVIYRIKPSSIDKDVADFDEPDIVEYYPLKAGPNAQLVVFLPGTNGYPDKYKALLDVVAQQGYRVIGLEYDTYPAVTECESKTTEPDCSADFRNDRINGVHASDSPVTTPPAETIVHRLTKLVTHLNDDYPDDHWGRYIDGPVLLWRNIVIGGISQGAGMAAFIAKRESVARVVLFSSPWDFIDATAATAETTASWVGGYSKTPVSLWFSEHHLCEQRAPQIVRAYKLAGIPASQSLTFERSDAAGVSGSDTFHTSTVRDTRYIPQWRFLFGQSPQ